MKIRQYTLQVPVITVDFSSYAGRVNDIFIDIKEDFAKITTNIFSFIAGFIRRRHEGEATQQNFQSERRFRLPFLNYKKYFKNLLILIAVPLLLIVVVKLFRDASTKSDGSQRIEVKGAIAGQDINREFGFPLKNDKGEEVSRVKYLVEKAELRDEIITGGKRATAVKGRMFLVLILKVTNEYEKPIDINTRDYVRLSVNGNEGELLAPETHNDPVEVQAISTKYTRVGFIVNDTDRDFVLHLGEIQGEKEKINLDLK
jgi:hypothetical protein